MKKEEERAEEYLKSLDYNNIVYEPNQNETPDFCIDDNLAIEVRRLNKNYTLVDNKNMHIEKLEIPIVKNIKQIIENYKCENFNCSAYLSIILSQPRQIEKKDTITNKIKKILTEHVKFMEEEKEYKVSDYLSILFTPTKKKEKIYIIGSSSLPFECTVSDLYANINLCINEKTTKILKNDRNNFIKYKEWWLILVDYVAYGMDNQDYKDLKILNIDKKYFSKIIILSYAKNSKIYEL